MEIRNNTPQISPAFGMALKEPTKVISKGKIVIDPKKASALFVESVFENGNNTLAKKGLSQIKNMLKNYKYYDVEYVPELDLKGRFNPHRFNVVDKFSGKVVASYDQNTHKPIRLEIAYKEYEKASQQLKNASVIKQLTGIVPPLIKFMAEAVRVATVKPSEVLPASLRAATEEATKLEKAAQRKAKNIQTAKKVFAE